MSVDFSPNEYHCIRDSFGVGAKRALDQFLMTPTPHTFSELVTRLQEYVDWCDEWERHAKQSEWKTR